MNKLRTTGDVACLLDPDWIQRLSVYKYLYIGFSGGLDSTVLVETLARCPSLIQKIRVIHVHHGLSPNASAWLAHCEQRCAILGLHFIAKHVEVGAGANLEERAREARYQVFTSLITENDAVLLAHHQNDQTETVLLNLLRGTGVDGLGAMPERRMLGKGELLRPFLHYTRDILHSYAVANEFPWIEDESNVSTVWSRAYIRHKIVPLLTLKWPAAVSNIATSALHCQQARSNLDVLAAIDSSELASASLTLHATLLEDSNRLCNVLRVWIKKHTMKAPSTRVMNSILEELIFAKQDANPVVKWGAFQVRRYRQLLYIMKVTSNKSLQGGVWNNFPNNFYLSETLSLNAEPDPSGIAIAKSSLIEVRFRQGGECFRWHGQTKSLKGLFQYWGIAPWQRDSIPLLYVDNFLVAVVGFAVSDDYLADGDCACFRIGIS